MVLIALPTEIIVITTKIDTEDPTAAALPYNSSNYSYSASVIYGGTVTSKLIEYSSDGFSMKRSGLRISICKVSRSLMKLDISEVSLKVIYNSKV